MTDVATRRDRTRRADDRHPPSGRAGTSGAAEHPSSERRPGFRPSARRRGRIALGVALGAAAVAVNLVLYTSLDRRSPVVQVVRDVPAGQLITAADLRTVEAAVDSTVAVVPDPGAAVGRYATVRLAAGSLLTERSLRSAPLLAPGSAVVAIRVPEGALPVGLRERVPVELVIPAAASATDAAPAVVAGRVVGLPEPTESTLGTLSLSIEVAAGAAARVAAADDVRVVLAEPSPDEAVTGEGG